MVDKYGIITDDIEQTEEYKKIEKELNEKLDIWAEENKVFGLGSCHRFWAKKKEILKTEYNIEWKSPQELNPTVFFD